MSRKEETTFFFLFNPVGAGCGKDEAEVLPQTPSEPAPASSFEKSPARVDACVYHATSPPSITMSRRAFALPFRPLFRPEKRQPRWICPRCLATQAETDPSYNQFTQARSISSSGKVDEPLDQDRDGPQSIGSTSAPPLLSLRPGSENPNESLPDTTTSPLPAEPRRLSPEAESLLQTPLPHKIPIHYLQHSTSDALDSAEKEQRKQTTRHQQLVGVVVSAGLMHKTVKVSVPGKQWHKRIGKFFPRPTTHLVHDPNSSLIAGDVVELHRLRVSAAVFHVVASIITPFEKPIADRPPIPTPDERLAKYKDKRLAKLRRRELRRNAAADEEEEEGEEKQGEEEKPAHS